MVNIMVIPETLSIFFRILLNVSPYNGATVIKQFYLLLVASFV